MKRALLAVLPLSALALALVTPSTSLTPQLVSAVMKTDALPPLPPPPVVPTTTTSAPSPPTTTSSTSPAAASRPSGGSATPVAPPVTPTTLPVPVGPSDGASVNTADWACIRQHESGDNYAEHGGGAYQFEDGTWQSVTGLPGPAESYPPAQQDAAALSLYAQRGFEPWTTRWMCGLG